MGTSKKTHSSRSSGGGLRLAAFDDPAPNALSLDFDPETEDLGLDSRAAASLKRANDRKSNPRRPDDVDFDARARPARSALRAAASASALEDDPRYAGKVVKVSEHAKRTVSSLGSKQARGSNGSDDDDAVDDSDESEGVAEEDDEELSDDDGVGHDDEDDEDEDDGSGGSDDGSEQSEDEAPEEGGVRQTDSLGPARERRGAGGDQSASSRKGRGRGSSSSAAAGTFIGDIDAELAALESENAAAAVSLRGGSSSSAQGRLASGDEDDAAKGRAVRDAQALYEAGLEARIRLQPALASAGRIPSAPVLSSLCASSPALQGELASTTAGLTFLLSDLLRLRAALLCRLPGVAAAAVGAAKAGTKRRRLPDSSEDEEEGGASDGSSRASSAFVAAQRALLPPGLRPLCKRSRAGGDDDADGEDGAEGGSSVHTAEDGEEEEEAPPSTDALWSSLEAGWAAFTPYKNDSLERWGRKLTYASGLSSKAAAKLKVLNMSVPAQVAGLMGSNEALERARARTRPPVGSVRVLGQPSAAASAASGASSSSSSSGDPPGAEEHVFNDVDFYTSLLKEFVASASSASSSRKPLPSEGAFLKPYGRKVREGVDRKATKGRRLRYVVQPKLVAFMAPAPYVVPPELAFDLDTVVASLFKS